MVIEAKKMIDEGLDVKIIYERLVELSNKVRVAFILDTLEYIKKGGRVSTTKATIGTLLNIKPIIHSKDGKLLIYEKPRGIKKGTEALLRYIINFNYDDKMEFALGSLGFEREMPDFTKKIKKLLGREDILIADVGTVIATYSGPNVRLVFISSKNEIIMYY